MSKATLPATVWFVPVTAILAEILRASPPIDVFVVVELPSIEIAVIDEFDLNTWDAAVDVILAEDVSVLPVILPLAVMFSVVPPTVVFVAVELPTIDTAVTVEFDLNC
jgi:hypothetical protein